MKKPKDSVHIDLRDSKFTEVGASVDYPSESRGSHLGGGLEGAKRTSRETATWQPPMLISPDTMINPNKEMADSRARDLIQNDGFTAGALHTSRDTIVGSQFLVNSQPNLDVLQQIAASSTRAPIRNIKFTDKWVEEFQVAIESRFNLLADSPKKWLDASRRNTLSEQVRLAISIHLMTGEVLATAEWIDQPGRPCKTALQMVSPSRLCNPKLAADTRYQRRGIDFDEHGAPQAYHIRSSFPLDLRMGDDPNDWVRVPAYTPWGRQAIIHIREQMLPDQSRGISEMVSAMKEMRMTKRFQEITLQNAVINATYAAAIETELPRDSMAAAMGAGERPFSEEAEDPYGKYMTQLSEYVKASDSIRIDGAKIPIMFPGSKLTTKNLATPGGVGTSYEESLMRNIAATFGISYEQFSRDFSKSNYSSARASMGETSKRMGAKKKLVADQYATSVFHLWLEEEIQAGNVVLPDGCTPKQFARFMYEPLAMEALGQCSWIGASQGQIDELKETQAAVLRINSGLSTWEKEVGRLGGDWRENFKQRKREQDRMDALGLQLDGSANKPGANMRQQTMTDNLKNDDDGSDNTGGSDE